MVLVDWLVTAMTSTSAPGSETDIDDSADPEIPEQWNHVSRLRPQLQKHVTAHPQEFRGSRWYILSDAARGRHLRFNDTAYAFVGRLDGEQTVEEIYQNVSNSMGDAAPTREDILSILTQLFHIDVLLSGMPADVEQLFKNSELEKNNSRVRRFLNPLAIRFPLIDPDKFLNQTITSIRSAYSLGGAVLWLFVVGFATMLLFVHFQELTASLKQNIFAPQNIILMLLLFPVMKALHEFAHAYTVKTWGGEVHEMGITLLVLMPVPYVDASAAWAFREKYKRVLVGASGMIMELFLAAIALIVWTMVEPGVIKDAALSVFLIGSVSTLLFNANPLLRFDGYYILQDIIEIPNLYSRAGKFNLYLYRRYLLGDNNAASPATDPTERKWLVIYGVLAWLYRLFISLTIAIFLAGKYFVIGIALAAWSLVLMFVLPIYRGIKYLITDSSISDIRSQAIGRTVALASVITCIAALIPFSLYTNAEGIVWVPDQAQIYAGSDGFIEQVVVKPGSRVQSGTRILQLKNPDFHTRNEVLQARHRELSSRLKSERFNDPIEADQTKEELFTLEADIASLQEERDGQTLISKSDGVFVLPEEHNLIGRYVRKGDPVAYIVNPDDLVVRLVVPQASVGLFSKSIKNIQVRLADNLSERLPAKILRQTPAGSNSLPSRALGAVGGGDIAVVGGDKNGTTTAEKVFQVVLALPKNSKVAGLGTRAFVRIDHGREILAQQWLRHFQQLLLNTLPF